MTGTVRDKGKEGTTGTGRDKGSQGRDTGAGTETHPLTRKYHHQHAPHTLHWPFFNLAPDKQTTCCLPSFPPFRVFPSLSSSSSKSPPVSPYLLWFPYVVLRSPLFLSSSFLSVSSFFHSYFIIPFCVILSSFSLLSIFVLPSYFSGSFIRLYLFSV